MHLATVHASSYYSNTTTNTSMTNCTTPQHSLASIGNVVARGAGFIAKTPNTLKDLLTSSNQMLTRRSSPNAIGAFSLTGKTPLVNGDVSNGYYANALNSHLTDPVSTRSLAKRDGGSVAPAAIIIMGVIAALALAVGIVICAKNSHAKEAARRRGAGRRVGYTRPAAQRHRTLGERRLRQAHGLRDLEAGFGPAPGDAGPYGGPEPGFGGQMPSQPPPSYGGGRERRDMSQASSGRPSRFQEVMSEHGRRFWA